VGSLEDNYTWEGALKYEGMLKETVEQSSPEELENVEWGGSSGDIVKAHDPDKAQPEGKCAVRHNTLFGNGNVVLGFFEQPDYDISYNHVYDGGHFCHDVSSIYTTLPQVRGSVVHHNWVHTIHKLCIRADDQSRDVTIHHNVMWGSKTGMLVVKGDDNAVYHNTTLTPVSIKNWGLNIQTLPEPDKPHYRKLWPLLSEQNKNTPIWNNLAHRITYTHRNLEFGKDDPRLSHNLLVSDPQALLKNPEELDFRPRKGSPLIDAAKPVTGINDDFTGKAPDIGAYEYGGEYWLPGYRNSVVAFEQTTNASGKEGQVKVTLAMPPLKTAVVAMSAPNGNAEVLGAGKLMFSPENWMVPQTVRFKIRQDIEAGNYLRFELEAPYESSSYLK
jgi:hypothetical protein